MGCCDIPPMGNFVFESHYDRINRDIKNLTSKLDFDFEIFRDFFFRNHDYAVMGFPKLIGLGYNVAIQGSSSCPTLFAVNTATKTYFVINKSDYEEDVRVWRNESEKDIMREKLKSVGVNVEW